MSERSPSLYDCDLFRSTGRLFVFSSSPIRYRPDEVMFVPDQELDTRRAQTRGRNRAIDYTAGLDH